MVSAPLLLISLRDGALGAEVAKAEYQDLLRAASLNEHDLDHLVLSDTSVHLGDLSNYCGIIVGGSSLNMSTEDYSAWQLHVHSQLEELIHGTVPVFLICFGTGWLAQYTGGKVDHAHSEESGPTFVKLTEAGRQDPLLTELPETFSSLTGHTESVSAVGTALTVLASGPTCPFQMVRYGDQVWASQFHAEMDAQAMETRMNFFFNYGYFSPEDYDAIVAQLPSIDTTYANQVLVNFVKYCRLQHA